MIVMMVMNDMVWLSGVPCKFASLHRCHIFHFTCCRLKKDILVHLTEVANEYRRKADANLPPTTKRLLMENYQLNSRVADMYDEIKLLQQQSVEWKAEDERQISHMRDLMATNTHITNRNITISMVHTSHQSFAAFELFWLAAEPAGVSRQSK